VPVGEPRRRSLWPFLAALIAAFVLFTLARSARRPAPVTTPPPAPPQPAAQAPAQPTIQPPPVQAPAEPAPSAAEPTSPETAVGGGPREDMGNPSSGGVSALNLYLSSHGASGQKNDFVLEGVTFKTGSATLTPEGTSKVDEVANLLKAHPQARIKVVGHTDDTGDPDTNRTLSQNRADSVRDELVGKGIAADRIETSGAGSENPIGKNDTAEGRAKNRRIDVIVLSQ
jgi:outer membrane protein OmpA-like peptidoglycan-associated protein